jgi:hypothetical protein
VSLKGVLTVKRTSLSMFSRSLKPVNSSSFSSKPGVPISSSTLRDGDLPRVGETGDCSGGVERALCDRGVKKRASGDDDIGEELNRLLK